MPAMTTRGIGSKETKIIAEFIHRALTNQEDEAYLTWLKKEVEKLCLEFPIPT
jgi:glycine/serine hydroxymethyltransferase